MPLRSLLAICLCLLMMLGLIFFHYTQSGIDALTVLSSLLRIYVKSRAFRKRAPPPILMA